MTALDSVRAEGTGVVLSMNGSGGPFGTLLLNNVVATKRTATVTTPNGTPTSQARVKVEWIGNPAVFGVNPADIQIGP